MRTCIAERNAPSNSVGRVQEYAKLHGATFAGALCIVTHMQQVCPLNFTPTPPLPSPSHSSALSRAHPTRRDAIVPFTSASPCRQPPVHLQHASLALDDVVVSTCLQLAARDEHPHAVAEKVRRRASAAASGSPAPRTPRAAAHATAALVAQALALFGSLPRAQQTQFTVAPLIDVLGNAGQSELAWAVFCDARTRIPSWPSRRVSAAARRACPNAEHEISAAESAVVRRRLVLRPTAAATPSPRQVATTTTTTATASRSRCATANRSVPTGVGSRRDRAGRPRCRIPHAPFRRSLDPTRRWTQSYAQIRPAWSRLRAVVSRPRPLAPRAACRASPMHRACTGHGAARFGSQ